MYFLCRMFEAISRRDDNIGRAGDQVVWLQDAIKARFRYIIGVGICDVPGQFPRGLLGTFKSDLHNLVLHRLRYLVPELFRSRFPIGQAFIPVFTKTVVPPVKRAARYRSWKGYFKSSSRWREIKWSSFVLISFSSFNSVRWTDSILLFWEMIFLSLRVGSIYRFLRFAIFLQYFSDFI